VCRGEVCWRPDCLMRVIDYDGRAKRCLVNNWLETAAGSFQSLSLSLSLRPQLMIFRSSQSHVPLDEYRRTHTHSDAVPNSIPRWSRRNFANGRTNWNEWRRCWLARRGCSQPLYRRRSLLYIVPHWKLAASSTDLEFICTWPRLEKKQDSWP